MKILMVCLGNICRSPLAHGIMENLIQNEGLNWTVDSAGTGDWHIGQMPDPRSRAVAKKYGIDISSQKARQIEPKDFDTFDFIFVMDKQNLENVRKMQPASSFASIELLDKIEVIDPYFDDQLFEPVFQQLSQTCQHRLAQLKGR